MQYSIDVRWIVEAESPADAEVLKENICNLVAIQTDNKELFDALVDEMPAVVQEYN
jgi:hypothetical protein